MIGLQDIIITQNINMYDLANQLGIHASAIYKWFNINKIPKKYLKTLSEIFKADEDYFNKKVNDIVTYKPKTSHFSSPYVIKGDITELTIKTRKGKEIIFKIDTEDLDKVLQYNWCAGWRPKKNRYYIQVTLYFEENGEEKSTTLLLHRFLTNAGEKDTVDHFDHDSLNNTKYNLILTTNIKNTRNRKGANKNNKCGYRNIHWNTDEQKWVVQLQINGKNTVLGEFAESALDKAVEFAERMREKYYGEFKGNG